VARFRSRPLAAASSAPRPPGSPAPGCTARGPWSPCRHARGRSRPGGAARTTRQHVATQLRVGAIVAQRRPPPVRERSSNAHLRRPTRRYRSILAMDRCPIRAAGSPLTSRSSCEQRDSRSASSRADALQPRVRWQPGGSPNPKLTGRRAKGLPAPVSCFSRISVRNSSLTTHSARGGRRLALGAQPLDGAPIRPRVAFDHRQRQPQRRRSGATFRTLSATCSKVSSPGANSSSSLVIS